MISKNLFLCLTLLAIYTLLPGCGKKKDENETIRRHDLRKKTKKTRKHTKQKQVYNKKQKPLPQLESLRSSDKAK